MCTPSQVKEPPSRFTSQHFHCARRSQKSNSPSMRETLQPESSTRRRKGLANSSCMISLQLWWCFRGKLIQTEIKSILVYLELTEPTQVGSFRVPGSRRWS